MDQASIKQVLDFIVSLISRRTALRNEIHDALTQKWQEIEQIHLLFTKSIRNVRDISLASSRRLKNTDDVENIIEDFHSEIRKIYQIRDESRHIRIAQFEEAMAYVESDWTEKHSIIKSLPDDITKDITLFMRSFCNYYGHDSLTLISKYDHILAQVLATVMDTIRRIKSSRGSNRKTQNLVNALDDISKVCDAALAELDERWKLVSRDYSRLKLNFRQLEPRTNVKK